VAVAVESAPVYLKVSARDPDLDLAEEAPKAPAIRVPRGVRIAADPGSQKWQIPDRQTTLTSRQKA